MFIDFSKVYVVESNIADDKIGPMTGSTGYVIPHWENFNYIVNDIKDYLSSNGSMKTPPTYVDNDKKNGNVGVMEDNGFYFFFKEMNVVFTKFGKDGNARCEKKPVVNVFPLPKKQDIIKKGFPDKILNDKLNGYIYNYVETILTDRKVSKIPTICVMIPYYTNKPEDITVNEYEYEAWCRSVLENGLLNLYSTACKQSRFVNTNEAVKFIVDYVVDNGAPPRLHKIEKLLKNNKNDTIYTLRQLLLSMVNNFDLGTDANLKGQGYPNRLRDKTSFDNSSSLCAHAWRIGFNSNKEVYPISASSLNTIIMLIASVQQELLSRSN